MVVGELALLADVFGQNLVDLLEIFLRVGGHYFPVEGLSFQSLQFDNIFLNLLVGHKFLYELMDEVFVGVAVLELLCGFDVFPAVLVAFLKVCSLVAVLFVHNVELFH